MIDPKIIINTFKKIDINFFSGVPDSCLDGLISYLSYEKHSCIHRIAANEGGAVALAIGNYLATSKIPVVYMQNSSLGHAINPLTSLADKKVYGIPMILLIGIRGGPGNLDEPQHHKMGPITFDMLKTLGIPYKLFNEKNYISQIKLAKKISLKKKQPFAIVVNPGTFIKSTKKINFNNKLKYLRKDFIEQIVKFKNKNTFLVGSLGNISREIYYFSEIQNKNDKNIFYGIGAMGHANQIGVEYAKNRHKKKIIV